MDGCKFNEKKQIGAVKTKFCTKQMSHLQKKNLFNTSKNIR